MSTVKLEYPSDNGLSLVEYRFYLMDTILYLDDYTEYNRPSKRHSFKSVKSYARLDKRRSTIDVSEVPLTEEIKQDALNAYISKLQVKLWDKK
ncbi:MAG: hypothetical protein KME47_09520 [Nodosilinea sp. WJT8-NPBG4]|jgi:hypothetical protein|nr:hypothetical protein [Nodosilinea sp. WJT8-NPBG4]